MKVKVLKYCRYQRNEWYEIEQVLRTTSIALLISFFWVPQGDEMPPNHFKKGNDPLI